MRVALTLAVAIALAVSGAVFAGNGLLKDVKTVALDPTVVADQSKVKDSAAAGIVQDELRDALIRTGFTVGDSLVHAHIVLEEFSSGSTAKRVLIGLGAGRSSVTARLILQSGGKDVADVRIHVRGSLAYSPYEGNNTQRRQAESSFNQRLVEEIERLK
jgi:hypothetical protein